MALSLCSASVNNTGELACDKSRGIPKKFFIFNGSFDAADYADEQAFFDAMVTNSKVSKAESDKIFVLNEVQEITDASEANKEGSLGLGFKKTLQEGRPAYKAKFFGGGDLLKRLRTFNNQTVRLIEFDANNVAWVYKTGTSAQGFAAKLFFTGNKLASGQNVEEGVIEVSISILSTSEYFDNCKWVNLSGFNIEDVKPLNDVTLTKVSNASNVYKYSVTIAGSDLTGGYDVLQDYGTEIAGVTFSAKSGATAAAAPDGSALAIDSVAFDAVNSLLTVTYNSTAYSSAGAYLYIAGPAPSVLDAANIYNIEILSATHAK